MSVTLPDPRAQVPTEGGSTVLTPSLGAVVVGALVVGVLAAVAPGAVALLVIAIAALAALAVAPLWVFAPLALVATVFSDVARVALGDGATSALLGQGRLITAVAAVVLVRVIIERRPLRIPRLAATALAAQVAAISLATVVGSASGLIDLAEAQRAISYALAIVVGVAIAGRPQALAPAVRGMALVTVLAGVLSLLYWGWVSGGVSVPGWLAALFEDARLYAQFNDLDPARSRVPWVDHHPNRVGVLFALLFAFLAPALLATRRRGDTLLAALVTLATVGGVLATQSRTGLVVFGAGAVVYLLLLATRRGTGGAPSVAAIALTVPAVWWLYPRLPQARTLSLETENFQSRQEIWSDAWTAFAEAPFLGHGFNYAGQSRFGVGLSAHNEYLAQAVDGGVVGAMLFLVMLVAFAVLAWRVSRRPGIEGGTGVGLLVLLAVLAISMTVGTTWRTAVPAILTWLCVGMVAALSVVPTQTEPAPTEGDDPREPSD